ncbi:MAG TPA: 6-phosphogluconolactonase [Caulobacteraceae bacterium]|nr:6-phosphogluconolactonase [Caulobacteraceae bacterium]
MTIDRFDSPEAMAATAAQYMSHKLGEAVAARGNAVFVATGGRTAGSVYDHLAQASLDWSRVQITLTDERWVDVTDPDSNERLVRERLLVGNAAAARFIGLRGDAARLEDAADAAATKLGVLPRPDVAMVGMGEDGHIASLFPGSPALELGLDPDAPLCIAVPVGEGRPPAQARLSLIASWLGSAPEIVLPITGPAKLRVAELALAGAEAEDLPVASLLKHGGVRFLWSA